MVISSKLLKAIIFWLVFATVLLCSVVLVCYRIDEPVWEAGHHGFVMSEYPHNALNYLRFGYLNTKLGLVTNYGEVKPAGGFSYRIDHGFITSILISFSYKVFGVHEWAGRLFPAMLSVGTAIVTFLLMLNLSGEYVTALIAFGFCALSPMQVYYGRLPAPHNVAVFLSLLAFYFYWLWLVKKDVYWLVGVFVTLIVGTYTDWITYFAIAPILLHYLLFYKEQKDWRIIIALAISPLVSFASYVMWTYWLMGDQALKTLWATFLLRSGSGHDLHTVLSIKQVLHTYYNRSQYWLTLPILVLSIGWIVRFCFRLIHKKVSRSHSLILAIFVFGFSHNLVFTNRVMVHDFIMFYQLIPAFAMASAFVMNKFILYFLRQKSVLVGMIIVMIFLIFIGQSFNVFMAEHSRPVAYTQAYYLGKYLNDTISISGRYIDAVDFYQNLGVLRTYVTADRPFKKISSLDEFVEVCNDPTYEVAVLGNSNESPVDLRKYLIERYPRESVAGYSVFKLHQAGSNVFVDGSVIEYPRSVKFKNQIEFMGFDIDKIVYRGDEQVNAWERYLNQNVELLPKYQTFFRVINYWRKMSETSKNYVLMTQFDAKDDKQIYRLEQSYERLNDLYPTSEWPVGRVIREAFEINIPIDYPSLNYSMWIGVEDATTPLAPENFSTLVDGNSRVRVGQTYVNSASTDLSPQLITAVDRSVDVDLEEGISLVHFRQSQKAVYPGDILRVGLTWRAQSFVNNDYKVFVHLIDSDEHLITQHDAEPNLGASPTSQWEPGALIEDVHLLLIPDESSDGKYYLQVGMYTEPTLERLPVLHSLEPSNDNAIILGALEVLSHE